MTKVQKLSMELTELQLRIRYAQDDLEEMIERRKRLEKELEKVLLAMR